MKRKRIEKDPIYSLIASNKIKATEELIKSGQVNLFQHYANGRTALHFAAFLEQCEIISALLSTSAIDVNAKDEHSYTPLHTSVKFDNTKAVKLLCQNKKVKINEVTLIGDNALHLAIKYNANVDIVNCLLGADIDCEALNQTGMTPFALAYIVGYKEVERLLLYYHAFKAFGQSCNLQQAINLANIIIDILDICKDFVIKNQKCDDTGKTFTLSKYSDLFIKKVIHNSQNIETSIETAEKILSSDITKLMGQSEESPADSANDSIAL